MTAGPATEQCDQNSSVEDPDTADAQYKITYAEMACSYEQLAKRARLEPQHGQLIHKITDTTLEEELPTRPVEGGGADSLNLLASAAKQRQHKAAGEHRGALASSSHALVTHNPASHADTEGMASIANREAPGCHGQLLQAGGPDHFPDNDAALSAEAGNFGSTIPSRVAQQVDVALAAAASNAINGSDSAPGSAAPGLPGPSAAAGYPLPAGLAQHMHASEVPKVWFEGMKLSDGRIYVPLPYIHRYFTSATFPVAIAADVYVNGVCIQQGVQVRIARSQNKTRRHGLGNHWVTGHQRLIKHYKGVRCQALELLSPALLRLDLTATGTWDGEGAGAGVPPAAAVITGAAAVGGVGIGGVENGRAAAPGGAPAACMGAEALAAGDASAAGLLGAAAAAAAGLGGMQPPLLGFPVWPPAAPDLMQAADMSALMAAQGQQAAMAGGLLPGGTPGAAVAAAAAGVVNPLDPSGALTLTAAAQLHVHTALQGYYAQQLALLQQHGQQHAAAAQLMALQQLMAAAGAAAGAGGMPAEAAAQAGSRQGPSCSAHGATQQQPQGGGSGSGAAVTASGGVLSGPTAAAAPGSGVGGAPGESAAPAALASVIAKPVPLGSSLLNLALSLTQSGQAQQEGGAAGDAGGGVDAGAIMADHFLIDDTECEGLQGKREADGQQRQHHHQQATDVVLLPPPQQQQQQQPQEHLAAATRTSQQQAEHQHQQPAATSQAAQAQLSQHSLPQDTPCARSSAAGTAPDAVSSGAAPPSAQQPVSAAAASNAACGSSGSPMLLLPTPTPGPAIPYASAAATAAAAAAVPGLIPNPLPPAAVATDPAAATAAAAGALNPLLPGLWSFAPSLAAASAAASALQAQHLLLPHSLGPPPAFLQAQGMMPAVGAAAAAAVSGGIGMAPGGLLPLDAACPAAAASTPLHPLLAAATAGSMLGPRGVGPAGDGAGGMLGIAGPLGFPSASGSASDAAALGAACTGASAYPRLYDGRVHVPLHLITQHFAASTDFPAAVDTRLFINSVCVGEAVRARVVKYKKHKRPNHFNFWITGLQKTLSRYTDVRQAGVSWEGVAGDGTPLLRVNLVAAA